MGLAGAPGFELGWMTLAGQPPAQRRARRDTHILRPWCEGVVRVERGVGEEGRGRGLRSGRKVESVGVFPRALAVG